MAASCPVQLHKSYFTLQCDLETDGRAWAYLNEFMCIGKNRNDYFVCLTNSIPIELEVNDGGASLVILHEKALFSGRRQTAQSILQFTLKHWNPQACIELKRENTGCLLLSNMGRKEMRNDAKNLLDLVKRALPEVRALWYTQSLEKKIQEIKLDEKMAKEEESLAHFPNHWIILFSGVISVSAASLETNVYSREKIEFELSITPLLAKMEEAQTIVMNLKGLHDDYISPNKLGLRIELDLHIQNCSLLFRIQYNGPEGKRIAKEMELSFSADHLTPSSVDPKQFISIDRIVLEKKEQSDDPMINLMITNEEISDTLAKLFDRESGVSVRLDRFLGRK